MKWWCISYVRHWSLLIVWMIESDYSELEGIHDNYGVELPILHRATLNHISESITQILLEYWQDWGHGSLGTLLQCLTIFSVTNFIERLLLIFQSKCLLSISQCLPECLLHVKDNQSMQQRARMCVTCQTCKEWILILEELLISSVPLFTNCSCTSITNLQWKNMVCTDKTWFSWPVLVQTTFKLTCLLLYSSVYYILDYDNAQYSPDKNWL